MIEHIKAQTYHKRLGPLQNAFTYNVDCVLTDLGPSRLRLLSRNSLNLWSLQDRHYGGQRGHGDGMTWFMGELEKRGFPLEGARILLLTQPSFLWFHFNPVSFWIALIDGQPCAFVAEVNNTFGHRHCYFCAHEDFRPILKRDCLTAEKMMHVSPFQVVAGTYQFNFGLDEKSVDIRISYENGAEGVLATLSGPRKTATSWSLLGAAIRRPMGAVRVLALIHWQALRLWAKRAPFLKKQPEPGSSVSDCVELQRSHK